MYSLKIAADAVPLAHAPVASGLLIASFSDPAVAAAMSARLGGSLAARSSDTLICLGRDWQAGRDPLIGVQGAIIDRRRSKLLTSDEIAASIARDGDAAFADWAPPFRVAWRSARGINAAADAVGLAHWYVWQGDGVAVIASTAAAIARAFGLRPDPAALGGLALTGVLLDDDSVIAGVRKLPAGHAAAIADGRLTLRVLPAASILAAAPDALQAATARMIAAFPDAEVELSGGWDSRMVLASIARADRRGRTAFTIGRLMDPDVIVARQLAGVSAMHHEVFDSRRLADIDAGEFIALVTATAARDDHGSNPFDRAVINFINAARPSRPRFSGQNGEILRGFYYPGQPLASPPSAVLAKRLIDWRIISNDVVDAGIFLPGWFDDMRAAVAKRIETRLLEADDPDWATAIDRYYLEQRMRRWCGTAISSALGSRPLLMPFFDADVLAAARAAPAREKAGSRFAASEIRRMDPILGRIALDSGLVPSTVAAGGLAGRVAQANSFAGKAIGKVRQRLFNDGRATLGSASALGLAAGHGMFDAVDPHRLAGLGIFAPAALEAFGRSQPGRATAGFVVNCDLLFRNLDV